jgi:hypothetical protein
LPGGFFFCPSRLAVKDYFARRLLSLFCCPKIVMLEAVMDAQASGREVAFLSL